MLLVRLLALLALSDHTACLGAMAGTPVTHWAEVLPDILTAVAAHLIPPRRERTSPRAIKRARHNSYRVKRPCEPASIRHPQTATIRLHTLKPPHSWINLR